MKRGQSVQFRAPRWWLENRVALYADNCIQACERAIIFDDANCLERSLEAVSAAGHWSSRAFGVVWANEGEFRA